MAMVINNNIPAINTKRNFSNSSNGMSGAMERLSSGLKINTGKDDPSGLSISEQLRAQKAGLERAKTNTEEAINVMSIAEGAMNEMNNILKKMKALAIHASNDGITSPDQIAADQAEMDSAIQTIDRIAQTTKFAGENLINGNKDLTYDQKTSVKATQNNSLLNARESDFSQIFKRQDYSVSINFSGAAGTVDACGLGTKVNFAAQASKAYFEIDAQNKNHASDLVKNHFEHEQQFTVTGNGGSRQITIGKGQHVGSLVNQINNSTDATGASAALVFNSNQRTTVATKAAGSVNMVNTQAYVDGQVRVFNNARNDDDTALHADRAITKVTTGAMQDEFIVGYNTDGQGNIYIKYENDNSAKIYKDASMSEESLVGVATRGTGAAANTFTVTGSNHSELGGLTWTIANAAATDMTLVKGSYINVGGITGAQGVTTSGALFGTPGGFSAAANGKAGSGVNSMLITGVELGKNTDDTGGIFLKTVILDLGGGAKSMQVFAYRDEKMLEKDLVAKSDLIPNADLAGTNHITLNALQNEDKSASTGLSIVLNTPNGGGGETLASIAAGTYDSKISFDNLGARIYANEYGEDQYVKITQDKGQSLSYFKDPGDFDTRTLVSAGETVKQSGQDAILSVNGRQVKTEGLKLRVATQDIQANFTFNEGKPGSTTLAQVGYGTGSAFTGIGALNANTQTAAAGVTGGVSYYVCNAGHNTSEKLSNFEGGMQLQLGEGAGSNDRTIVAIKSMTAENLGRTTKTGMFEIDGKPIYTTKTFTMKDMMSGGHAALAQDATLAMEIIEKSIDDVSGMRATLGAMQSNLLQTNSNNLSVTIENITKTESGIRDADMADEMTDFTKYQVLQNAAMSMLTQANQASQSVLQLLQ